MWKRIVLALTVGFALTIVGCDPETSGGTDGGTPGGIDGGVQTKGTLTLKLKKV